MRKIKNKKNNVEELENSQIEQVDEKEPLKTKIIIILGWIIPFFALYVLYFFNIKLPKRTKNIMVEILNKNFTMIFVYLIGLLVSRNVFIRTQDPEAYRRVISFVIFLFAASMLFQAIKSYYWLKGKDVKYRYTLKFFRKEN